MIKKISLIIFVMLNFAYASYKEGKALFEKKCSSCHGKYVSLDTLKINFFEKKNKMLNIEIPTENMLVYAIMRSAKKIGDPEDEDMREIEIEEFLKSYLEKPERHNTVCDDSLMKYYKKKEPMKISDEEATLLTSYIMNYDEERLKKFGAKKKVLKENYKEEDIIKEARKEDKLIMVYATSKTCYFCKKMEAEVLQDTDVQKAMKKNYLFYEIDVDFIKLPFNLKRKYKGITPTFFVLTQDGEFLNSYPGSWNKSDFFLIMKENL